MKKKINGLLMKGSMLLIIFIIAVTGKITAQKAGNYATGWLLLMTPRFPDTALPKRN